MEYYYTNLCDSVIYADFKIHFSSVKTVMDKYKSELVNLLKRIKNNVTKYGLVLTLNQICDNNFINFSADSKFPKEDICGLIKDLIIDGKLKISTYPGDGEDLVKYSLSALEKCTIRLCEGVPNSELIYISSLIPELGTDKTNLSDKLNILLGYSPHQLEYDNKNKQFKEIKTNGTILTFNNFSELTKHFINNNRYGIYSALKLYSEKEIDKVELKKIDKKDLRYSLWIRNIVELNELCNKYDAFVPNVKYVEAKTNISVILKMILNNEQLLDEILRYCGGNIINQTRVRDGIVEILKKISDDPKNTNRTVIYTKLKSEMQKHADDKYTDEKQVDEKQVDEKQVDEKNADDDALLKAELYKRFAPKSFDGNAYYKRVLFSIIHIVDYAYNILNNFYSSETQTMLECFAKIKSSGSGIGLTLDEKEIFKLQKVRYEIVGEKIERKVM